MSLQSLLSEFARAMGHHQRERLATWRDQEGWRRRQPVCFFESMETRLLLSSWVVTSTADSGAGSLRQAIVSATSGDSISFNIAGGGVHSIAVASNLPQVNGLTIDATTQAGWAVGAPVVELNGAGVSGSGYGFWITGGSTTIKGFVINRFSTAGILIQSNSNDLIAGNFIGTNAAGTAALGNNDGIYIYSGSNNTIGGATAALRNVISGNTDAGIDLYNVGANNNKIYGNFIGTDLTGTLDLANSNDGIVLNGGGGAVTGNQIGGTAAGQGNVISGNQRFGINMQGSGTTANTVVGNYIGLDASGALALPNVGGGVGIYASASSNTIGGTTAGGANIISGNGSDGINIQGSSTHGNVVLGNRIGTNAFGTAAVPNATDGIEILLGTYGNTIGGTAAGAGNLISGNTAQGVAIESASTTGNVVQGNFVGLNAAGNAAIANGANGILINSTAAGNTIGGATLASGNYVAGNTLTGIGISDAGTTSNTVQNNYLGYGTDNTTLVANGFNPVFIDVNASGNTETSDTVAAYPTSPSSTQPELDLMVLYTPAALAAAGSVAAMHAAIVQRIADGNTALSNSQVNATYHLAYDGLISYTESGSINTDLSNLETAAGNLSGVPALRDQYNADLVALWTNSGSSTYSGLGTMLANLTYASANTTAFSVEIKDWLPGHNALRHEIGHNLGATHDPANASGNGALSFSYGYTFTIGPTLYGDLMSYPPATEIAYYSNPNVNYLGTPTGSASANNALTLNLTAHYVAAYRTNQNLVSSTTALTSTANPATYHQSITLSATVTSSGVTPTGTVSFYDGATLLGSAALNGSAIATFTSSTLALGSHTLSAIYSGDTTFATSTGNLTQTINPATSSTTLTSTANPATFHQSITLTATVTSAGGTPTGSVSFYDSATLLGAVALNGSGVAIFTSSTLAQGSHSLSAVYSGDSNFLTSTGNLTQTINPATTTTTLTSGSNPAPMGQTINLTATVTSAGGTPTGTVSYFDGATLLGTRTLASGVATLSVSSLTVGAHSFSAVYSGDSSFPTSTGLLTQNVIKITPSIGLDSSSSPSAFGQSLTLTATVSSALATPTGSVTFFDGSTSLGSTSLNGSGIATLSISTLSIGTHPLSAVYAGDSNFLSNTSLFSEQINRAASGTALTSSANPATYNQSITLSATVTVTGASPTGSVTFRDGATTLGAAPLNNAGVATLAAAFTAGSHNLTAIYAGGSNFTSSTSPAYTQSVNKITPTITWSTPAPITYGTALGTAQLTASTTIPGTLIYTIIAGTVLHVGTPQLSVNFTPTDSTDYNAASAAVNLIVNPTLLTVTANAQTRAYGAANPALTYSLAGLVNSDHASVVSGTPAVWTTGTTSSTPNSYPITITANTLAASDYTLNLVPGTLTVTKAASTTTLTSTSTSLPAGQAVTFTATVTPTTGSGITGTVQFQIDGSDLGTPVALSGSTATFTTSDVPAGNHALAAIYSGDGNFATCTSNTLSQRITQGTNPSATTHLIVTGPDAGDTTDGPLVKVFDAATGNPSFSFLAYDRRFLGAVRVAMGDFNGDGVPDIVTATGSGGQPLVNVYDGVTGAMFGNFYAYSPDYLGGVEVAVADVTGSGHPDIITSTDTGGVPLVNVFNSAGTLLLNFWAYDSHYLGGVRIASGDFNGDGKAQIVTSTAGGGQPLVNLFNSVGTLLGNCWGDDPSYTAGLQIAVGAFTNDGLAKVATYRDQATAPQVKLYDLSTQQQFKTLTLADPTLPLHLRLAATDANNDGIADLVTVPTAGNTPQIEVFSGIDGSLIRQWSPYASTVTTGLFVAAG